MTAFIKFFILGSSVLLGATSTLASTIVNFTNQTGATSDRDFTSGDITLTFAPSADSPQPYVTSSAAGVCLFANTTSPNTTNRCNVLDAGIGTGDLNYISMTSNKSIFLIGGKVEQITGVPGNIDLSYTFGGPSIGIINASTGDFTFSSPITLTQGQEIIFSGSGIDSSLRVSSFTVDVPGPLPLLGAAAAFGYSRKLRKKTRSII